MPNGSLNWCFTTNNYQDEHLQLIATLHEQGQAEYIIYGKEEGEGGTPHLQGYVRFTARKSPAQVQRMLPGSHVTIARNVGASIQYCKKDGDVTEFGEQPERSAGRRSDLQAFQEDVKQGNVDMKSLREIHPEVCAKYPRFVMEYVFDNTPIRAVEEFPLHPWQIELRDHLDSDPDERTIVFVIDFQGNQGKSWFAKWYRSKHPDITQIIQPGRKADMAFTLNPNARNLFIDAPRSKQGEFIQYDFLEQCKDGQVFSTKYESRMKELQKVHVVVLMNEEPDPTKLSQDRYKFIRIGNAADNFNLGA